MLPPNTLTASEKSASGGGRRAAEERAGERQHHRLIDRNLPRTSGEFCGRPCASMASPGATGSPKSRRRRRACSPRVQEFSSQLQAGTTDAEVATTRWRASSARRCSRRARSSTSGSRSRRAQLGELGDSLKQTGGAALRGLNETAACAWPVDAANISKLSTRWSAWAAPRRRRRRRAARAASARSRRSCAAPPLPPASASARAPRRRAAARAGAAARGAACARCTRTTRCSRAIRPTARRSRRVRLELLAQTSTIEALLKEYDELRATHARPCRRPCRTARSGSATSPARGDRGAGEAALLRRAAAPAPAQSLSWGNDDDAFEFLNSGGAPPRTAPRSPSKRLPRCLLRCPPRPRRPRRRRPRRRPAPTPTRRPPAALGRGERLGGGGGRRARGGGG